MLNTPNIQKINSMGYSRKANCWGSTQFALSALKEPVWQTQDKMENFLKYHTVKVYGALKKGDILIIRDKHRNLVHTAVYDSAKVWWHKPGMEPSEFAFEKRIKNMYEKHGGSIYEYRRFCNERVIRQNKQEEKKLIKDIYGQLKKLLEASWNTIN